MRYQPQTNERLVSLLIASNSESSIQVRVEKIHQALEVLSSLDETVAISGLNEATQPYTAKTLKDVLLCRLSRYESVSRVSGHSIH